MKLTLETYSCNYETYNKWYFEDIADRIYKKHNSKNIGYDTKVIKLDGKNIQSQRSPSGIWSRSIFVYLDDKLTYIIALSNTNYDEDKLVECNKIGKKSTYGVHNYHANTYLVQGINKNFEIYHKYKQEHSNITLLFYMTDIEQSYPHNKFNLMCYRKLATIGFEILNIDKIDFYEFKEIKKGAILNKNNLHYTSLNEFINDSLVISRNNKGNIPSYMNTFDDYNSNGEKQTKYIYIFKALGAQTYDSFLTMWTIYELAKKENKNVEFLFSKEQYNFNDRKNIKTTKNLAGSIISLFKTLGIDIKYETSDEIRQELNRQKDQFNRAKKNNELRNQELFKNNMRARGIQTKCCLCGCEIENILEAAHIWGIAELKKADTKTIRSVISNKAMQDLIDITSEHKDDDFYKKYMIANSGDNGIWLCSNHHGLFDSHYFCFDSENGKIIINTQKLQENSSLIEFFNKITINRQLPNEVMSEKTKIFLSKNQINIE